MIWQHKEEQQKQKAMNDYYRQVREEYKSKLIENFSRHQPDPKHLKETMEVFEHPDQLDN
jgi:hypothetical protein